MSSAQFIRRIAALFTGVILVFLHMASLADEEADATESSDVVTEEFEGTEETEVTEEIIVYGSRRGNKIDVDVIYEELIRSNLIKEFIRAQELEEENKWRLSLSEDKSSSRIKWGYDLDAELRMRRDTELTDLPIDDTKPATVFRFEF